MDVYVDTSLAKSFSILQILDVRFCIVVSCVLGMGWESAFVVLLFLFWLSPQRPPGVRRRSFGASVQVVETGLGIGLSLESNRGLVAESLTVICLLGNCVNRGEEQVAQQGKVILQLEKNEV